MASAPANPKARRAEVGSHAPENKPRFPSQRAALAHFFLENRLNLLLLFVPVSIVLWLANFGAIWVFLASGVAIVPLAALISNSTEQARRAQRSRA